MGAKVLKKFHFITNQEILSVEHGSVPTKTIHKS